MSPLPAPAPAAAEVDFEAALGKVALTGYDDGFGGGATLFDPASTHWYDGTWWTPNFNGSDDLNFTFGVKNPSLDDHYATARFMVESSDTFHESGIELKWTHAPHHAEWVMDSGVNDDLTNLYSTLKWASTLGDGIFDFEADDTQFSLVLRGETGQATKLLDLQSANTTSIFQVTGDRKVGFYGAAPVALQAGVGTTAGAIHAALVNLGLITA